MIIKAQLRLEQKQWERSKTRSRDIERKEKLKTIGSSGSDLIGIKRKEEMKIETGSKVAPSKRRKFVLLGDNMGSSQSQILGSYHQ